MTRMEINRRQLLLTGGAATGAVLTTGGLPASAAAPALSDSNGLVVATAAGRVKGSRDGAVRSFKGIPYAAPPVGELRFLAPKPPLPWKGVREAITLGNPSVQNNPDYPAWLDPQPESEDC